MTGNLCKQVEFLFASRSASCAIWISEMSWRISITLLPPAKIDECRAGKDGYLPPFPVNNHEVLQPGPFEDYMLKAVVQASWNSFG